MGLIHPVPVSAIKETEFLSLPRYTVPVDLVGLSTKALAFFPKEQKGDPWGSKTKKQVVIQELEKGVLHTYV